MVPRVFFALLQRCHAFIISVVPTPCLWAAAAAALRVADGRPCPINKNLSIVEPLSFAPPPRTPSQNDAPLQRVFELFDSNNDQLVSITELREGLAKLGMCFPEEQLELLMTSASEKELGELEFHEFKSLYDCLVADGTSTEQLMEAFRVFDLNGDGFICVSELQTVLSSMGFSQCLDKSFCESILHRIDSNSDGRIDFWEFSVMMSDFQCSNSSFSSLESVET